ncbi:MAG: hypothetical protein KatS3mg082_0443 [Nitrospiraceae bacterium]|nr:MAG: hypothetical protein KatS3mg082_0443 [Nitrospiraceae bacterium]
MNADVMDKFKLPASMLAPRVEPSRLGFADTSELDPLDDTIGQERAVEALEFGLRIAERRIQPLCRRAGRDGQRFAGPPNGRPVSSVVASPAGLVLRQ